MTHSPFPWFWRQGELVAREQFHIDPDADGLLFGLGLFETTRTWQGLPWLWEAHLDRLLTSAKSLGFAVDDAALPSSQDVARFVDALGSRDVVVRLNVAAGSAVQSGPVWMTARPLPAPRTTFSLCVSRRRPSADDPFACHKTFNYGLRLLAHREAVAAGCDDCLLLDVQGRLLESAHANVYLRLGEEWVTPALAGAVLPGTVRRRLLEDPRAPKVVEREVFPEDLLRSEEAFLTNSVRGVVPVGSINGRTLQVGGRTSLFAELLASTHAAPRPAGGVS